MLDFIINPTAGKAHGKKNKSTIQTLESVLKERKVEYAFHFTEYKRHAVELTGKLIKNGATDVIAVGGDGTLHEVVNGFTDFDKASLGLIPCGTGNDFASALNLPSDPVKALNLIIDGTPKFVDFMQMPTVRGINVIGTGIDVDVLKRYEALKKKNKFGYTKSLIKTLFKYKCTKFKVAVDGIKKDVHTFIAAIANGNVFGGGIPLCPVASPTDNKLNFLTVKAMNKIKIIGAFLKLKAGKILSVRQTEHSTCTEVKIDMPTPYTVNVDGELYENIPFEIKIVPNTLRMYR